MGWQPRVITNDVHPPSRGKVSRPGGRLRFSLVRKAELAAMREVIDGYAPLSIDDLLKRPDRTQAQVLNAVGERLAREASVVLTEVWRLRNGHWPMNFDFGRYERAMKLHHDLGRMIALGRAIAEAQQRK